MNRVDAILLLTLVSTAACLSVGAGDRVQEVDLEWSRPVPVEVESLPSVDQKSRSSFGSLAIASDGQDGIHVFAAPSRVSQKKGVQRARIEHVTIRGQEHAVEPPLSAVDHPVLSIARPVASEGRIQLLWAEEKGYYPDAHPSRLYWSQWSDLGWSTPERVSDAGSRPGVLVPGQMTLFVGDSGIPEACWRDWRETHFWATVLHRGEGDYPKAYCVSRAENGWTRSERVQRRGKFEVWDLSAATNSEGVVSMFWTESRDSLFGRNYSTVRHAIRVDGTWKPSRRKLTDPRDYDGDPGFTQDIGAAGGPGGTIVVAWISTSWPGEYERKLLALEVRTYSSEGWSEDSVVLSRRARESRWVSGVGETAGLLYQEYPDVDFDHVPPDGFDLFFVPVGELNTGSRALVASRTRDGAFDATVSRDGTIHFVYLETAGSGAVALQYRQVLPSDARVHLSGVVRDSR